MDQDRVDVFAARMTDVLNGGMLSLMISIGHRTGLFDAMAELPPLTSEEVADAAGLNERYVREWLNTMVAGRIVDYAAADGTYALPREHAALLARAAGPDNLAVLARTVPLLAGVEDRIVGCFRDGGGVFYDQYVEFMATWGGLKAQVFDATLVSTVMPLMPDVVEALGTGIDALEIGCGDGHATNLLARAYPNSRFTGYDIRDDALAAGRTEAGSLGLGNVRFAECDLTTMDDAGAYDLVAAFDVIHDQARPRTVLRNVFESLRAGGTFLMVDIKASSHVHENLDQPMAPFLYGTSTLHCMAVSLARDGEGLGTMWGEQQARELLAEAGFADVAVHEIEGDAFNSYYVARR